MARHVAASRPAATFESRIATLPRTGLPIGKRVTIRWNLKHVPFIEADTDDDLAVALGVVHAHLRLGQLELMRRIAQGRVSELIGSVGVPIDQLLRTLDVGRAVPAILAAIPHSTRTWLQAFVRGLNHHLAHVRPLPAEFALFAIEPEAWTIADVLTLGRLVSADVNWIIWFQLLRFHGDADWPALWRRLLAVDSRSCWTNENGADSLPHLAATLRTGSNSFVVAPFRSATGAALIASDPHLSITLPNSWLLAAFKSPSFHAAGLMVPGLPFIALGRNPWIAWGGTSLHAASTDLVALRDLSSLAEREVELAVRWGRRRKIRIRESKRGPVITDVPLLSAGDETYALRWMGHRRSDEVTAMLAVNRAQSVAEIRAALGGFAVPGQNMLCADVTGHIGRLMAVHLPRRSGLMPDDIAIPPDTGEAWDTPMTGADLPVIADPPDGFITSANERPPEGSPIIGHHFSPADRKQRLELLLAATGRTSFETAAQIQSDVHWEAALVQRRTLLTWLNASVRQNLNHRQRQLLAEVENWDGRYHATSRGALAFEVLCYHLVRILVPNRRRAAYSAAWGTRRLIWDDVLSADHRQRQLALRRALRKAATVIGAGETWGSRHRLRIAHPLGLLPVIGRAWRFTDLPVAGTSDTLMKTAHAFTDRRHGSRYGSVARHISDLSDLDQNYFVLLGGQDGWLGSTTLLDQIPLWQRGEYIRLPLRPETARAEFHHQTDLMP